MQWSHKIWLDAHPARDKAWLIRVTELGFEVHHIDGISYNNDPSNLVLIETGDHTMLHGADPVSRKGRLRTLNVLPRPSIPPRYVAEGRQAYELRYMEWLPWPEISRKIGADRAYAHVYAKQHAKRNNLEWPIKRRIWE